MNNKKHLEENHNIYIGNMHKMDLVDIELI